MFDQGTLKACPLAGILAPIPEHFSETPQLPPQFVPASEDPLKHPRKATTFPAAPATCPACLTLTACSFGTWKGLQDHCETAACLGIGQHSSETKDYKPRLQLPWPARTIQGMCQSFFIKQALTLRWGPHDDQLMMIIMMIRRRTRGS